MRRIVSHEKFPLHPAAQFTIPDFLAARYGGGAGGRGAPVRAMAVGATIIVSFTYVVAQIYAVGLIASRFTGVDFSVGIFLGLASTLTARPPLPSGLAAPP